MKVVFVRHRERKKQWVALLSTDTELAETEIVRAEELLRAEMARIRTEQELGVQRENREREIADLKKKYADLEKERKAAADRLSEKKQKAVLAAVQVDALVADLHDRDIDLERQNDKLSIIQRDMESAQADRETLEEELTATGDNIRSIQERKALLDSEQTDLEEQGNVSRQQIVEESKALYALRKRRED